MGAEFNSWNADAYPWVVSYTVDAMEGMRRAAMEGLQRIPRRGLEVGGVMFGNVKGAEVRITQWRAMECEHAKGPGFELSPNDEEGLRRLLEEAATDPELSELVPVGWFRTRTRGGVCLSVSDPRLHDEFFPEPWQVILVLRPHMYEPAQAGFFLREEDGSIKTDSSYKEFLLENKRRRLPLGFDPSRPYEREGAPREVPPLAVQVPPGVARQAEAAVTEPPDGKPGRASRWRKIGSVVAAIAAVAVTFYLAIPELERSGDGALDLQVRDVEGRLLLEWNRRAPAVRNASAASLLIADGAEQRQVGLTLEELRGGSLTYQRRGGDVQFRLRLDLPEGGTMTEIARFLGGAPAASVQPPPPSDGGNSQQLAADVDQLRSRLADETRRRDELQRQIRAEQQRAPADARRVQ